MWTNHQAWQSQNIRPWKWEMVCNNNCDSPSIFPSPSIVLINTYYGHFFFYLHKMYNKNNNSPIYDKEPRDWWMSQTKTIPSWKTFVTIMTYYLIQPFLQTIKYPSVPRTIERKCHHPSHFELIFSSPNDNWFYENRFQKNWVSHKIEYHVLKITGYHQPLVYPRTEEKIKTFCQQRIIPTLGYFQGVANNPC